MVKDNNHPSKYFHQIFEESVFIKIPHQNFALHIIWKITTHPKRNIEVVMSTTGGSTIATRIQNSKILKLVYVANLKIILLKNQQSKLYVYICMY